jgi:hypothetical protein
MRCNNWRWLLPTVVLAVAPWSIPTLALAGSIATFENGQVPVNLGSESEWHGVDDSEGNYEQSWFSVGGYSLNNYRSDDMGYWDNFSYSNKTNTSASGMAGQFTAYSHNGIGGGAAGSANYGIGYVGYFGWLPQVVAPTEQTFAGAYFANNAYAYHSMETGDSAAKKFGGVSGTDSDWFKLTIYGLDSSLARTGKSVDFYLADYRSSNSAEDYIVKDWAWVDLRGLGSVSGLEFALSSSDVGKWGMNTPAYFAMDSLSAVPEPSSVALLCGAGLAGTVVYCRRRLSFARATVSTKECC